ncbi:MAG: hypothetical protein IAG13_35405 [Deltaproteobacteria bacterium]|nr:hypothetical protein [Nannocystaceae bacterium]
MVLKLANGRQFTAKRLKSVLRDSKSQAEYHCVTYYFFVGHDRITHDSLSRTLIDMKDRLVRGMDQRWAYVSAAMPFGKIPWIENGVTEKEADEKLRGLLIELAATRGRVLVALTGGASSLRTYHDDDGRPRAALVAPAIASVDEAADWPNTSVFNFAAADVALAGELAAAGHVVRVWGNEDAAAWQAAIDVGVHHVATDKVSAQQDPWARTHDDDGWPFRCIDTCVPIGPEPGAVIGIDVDSGDIWDEADSAWFVHDDLANDPDHQWRAMISTANSHVEPFAKGCLMARATLDVAAPYFAVCRTADEQPLRVQWRAEPGALSTAIEADIAAPDTVDPSSVAFVRLRVEQSGHCVAGDGSRDGQSWVEIGTHCFTDPLPLQGIAAASHDAGEVRMLFVELRRDDAAARSTLDFDESTALGDGSATVYDGVMP